MKITKIVLIIIFLLPLATAQAEVKITKWNESINLTQTGRRSEVVLKVQAVNLIRHYYHDFFTFQFGSNHKIRIIGVKFNNRTTKYTFENNLLKINFHKRQFNNDDFIISFIYEAIYDKIYQYLRKEAIRIPKSVAGADAYVTIGFLWSLESATLNQNIKKVGNKFVYQGVVPKDGVFEIVKLTPSKNIWDVVIDNTVTANRSLGNIKVSVPIHFKNSGQKSENYRIISKPNANSYRTQAGETLFRYVDLKENKINIESKTRIYTGKIYRFNINKQASDYLDVDPADTTLLAGMLQQIKDDPKLQGLPLYAKIGRFVNNFIKYDISFVGKKLDIEQIISGKTGVCVEYAKLYNVLARIAKIPAVMVAGKAYGEYDKFEGHAWNLIYDKNRWIYVDPTWDLMSGVVSSSHIYFYDYDTHAISANFSSGRDDIKLGGEFKITKIQ